MTLNINIISEGNTERSKMFSHIISKTEFDFNGESNDNTQYDIFFDEDLISEKDKETSLSTLLAYKDIDEARAIFDITKDYFEDETLNPLFTLCIVCAGFVTCANDILQEKIYYHTGRMAFIVDTPVLKEHLLPPDSNETKDTKEPNILWYGSTKDIFSVKRDQLQLKDTEIKIMLSGKVTDRVFNRNIEQADILYFPETFNEQSELDRTDKVKEAITKGKFVVAPNLPLNYTGLGYNKDLKNGIKFYKDNDIQQWILEQQKKLLKHAGEEKTQKQIIKVFQLAPDEDFLDNLEYYLENEKISI